MLGCCTGYRIGKAANTHLERGRILSDQKGERYSHSFPRSKEGVNGNKNKCEAKVETN